MKILLVDDTEPMRRAQTVELAKVGYRDVVEAGSGAEAIRTLKATAESGGKVDVILADWDMHGMSGCALIARLVEATDNTVPVIVMLSSIYREVRGGAIQAGARACLFKPFSPLAARETIEKVTADSVLVTTTIAE